MQASAEPHSYFNSVQVSSGVLVILLFGSLYVSAAFSAHHLNRHTDLGHSALLTVLLTELDQTYTS